MLLPVPERSAVATAVQKSRRRMWVAAALVATAATVLVTIQVALQKPHAGPAIANNGVAPVIDNLPTSPAGENKVEKNNAAAPVEKSAPLEVAGTAAPETKSTDAKPNSVVRLPGKMHAVKPGLPKVKDVKLDELAPGQVVEAIDTTDGTITIVKLYAVDHIPGFQIVQKVLSDNAIAPDTTDAPNATAPKAGEKQALYVEATREQLTTVLTAIQKEGLEVSPKNVEQLRVKDLAPPVREALVHHADDKGTEKSAKATANQRRVNIPETALQQAKSGPKPPSHSQHERTAPVYVLFVIEEKS
jgi:hypothetical protein